MLLTILFGIGAAITWGTADFCARQGSEEIGFLPTLMGMNGVGALLLAAVALAGLLPFHPHHLFLLALLALGNTVGGLLFYYALEHGQLSLVSPITAAYPVVSAMLAWFLAAQHLGPLVLAAVLVVIVGTMLATQGNGNGAAQHAEGRRALLAAAGGAFCFGVVFYFLARLGATGSLLMPILMFRWVGVLVLAPVALRRCPLVRTFSRPMIWATGILDTSAYLLYLWGSSHGPVAVIAALAGLFSVWTILLAITLLKERLSPLQWTGVSLILLAIGVLSSAR